MTIRHIVQPVDSSLCGQCCIAMAAGISLSEAIKTVGHKRGTRTKEVVAALRALGINCEEKLVRISRKKPVLPKRAILAIGNHKRKRYHWMLSWDGELFDPGDSWPRHYNGEWAITSYLKILS